MYKDEKTALINTQIMHEKILNRRFESNTEILHQCKIHHAGKSKAGQIQREAQTYIPDTSVYPHISTSCQILISYLYK